MWPYLCPDGEKEMGVAAEGGAVAERSAVALAPRSGERDGVRGIAREPSNRESH